jgi:dihydrofolate synthase/folylpolyglutamate synthase
MDYLESLRWLQTLPDFERTGDFADRPDLAPMRALLDALANPQGDGAHTIHVAGSKGKGSTGAMIETILNAFGGPCFYVSPHLHRYTERVRVTGGPDSPEVFAAQMTRVRAAVEQLDPDLARRILAFDVLTATAFCVFQYRGSDVNIIEVGLGGLLDSTNVFDATDVVVLTPISLEHTAILGDTIAAIARQKAGIIKPGSRVVVAPQRESALDVFREVAAEKGATIIEVAQVCQMTRTSANAEGQEFRLKTARAEYRARLPLLGRHQLDNAATAIVACEEYVEKHDIELTPEHVREGLAKVSWPGRMEVLKRSPLVVVDGAHNGDSAKCLVDALRDHFALSRVTLLFGTLAGKDVDAMAAAVAPIADAVFVTSWDSARAADPRSVADAFRQYDIPVTVFGDLAQAYEAAASHAGARGSTVAFGSIAFVAQVREYVLGIESDRILLST